MVHDDLQSADADGGIVHGLHALAMSEHCTHGVMCYYTYIRYVHTYTLS